MLKRFPAITVLAVALLFSQGGNFLVASLCPHLRTGMASCEKPLAGAPMSHDDMGDMHMDSMEHEGVSNPDPDAVSLGQPIGPCSHCAVHSRTSPNTASLGETEAAKSAVDFNIPLQFSRVTPIAESPVAVLTSRAHGPPGQATSRYILINIFRI